MSAVIVYNPQPKQREFHECPANEILFGGAAGPGKSKALRHEGLIWALRISLLQVYLFRRTFPELDKNHIIPSREEFPRESGSFIQKHNRWEFVNGSMLHMCHCQHEKHMYDYQGAEIHLLLIDELTTFTELQYKYLRGRVRTTLDIPEKYQHKIPGVACGSNPGGISHAYIKKTFVDFCGKKGGIKRAPANEGGMLRAYIPALLHDNPRLMLTDPEYINRLEGLPEPYRTAYKTGNWEIFFGQVFAFTEEDHVIDPCPIPDNAKLYFTYDDGFGAPFSCGWWFIDQDGRAVRFAEFYGQMEGAAPNTGKRMGTIDLAEKILEIEADQKITGRPITRLCDPTCFNHNPERSKGGQGPSVAEDFAKKKIFLTAGDPSRKQKIRQFHERLKVKRNAQRERLERPMMVVFRTCEAFIRTIPLLQADPHNVEDIDTRMEDHVYDEACHICMDRPLATALAQPGTEKLESTSRPKDKMYKG